MVARINTGKNISKTLNYNEQKVQQGFAEILDASGFLKDAGDLNFYDKLLQFERHISLNENVVTNTLHVSLNFDPSEQLSNETMKSIAADYMDKIGFGHQPFLVYRHYDAGHPHIHIVSTNIEMDGNRISMHNLARNQSETARRQIETAFNLLKADGRDCSAPSAVIPVNAQKVSYGKSATKRAISNVLLVVLAQYKFSSLPQLNAVLGLYNVMADRGKEGSRLYLQNGLLYRVLDEAGNKTGTPIKASAFYMKPTLSSLEKKFEGNEADKIWHKKRMQVAIDWAIRKKPGDLEGFIKTLDQDNITTVLRKGREDAIYGITYIDHRTKCVFNGSELGKTYSARSILASCRQEMQLTAPEITPDRSGLSNCHPPQPISAIGIMAASSVDIPENKKQQVLTAISQSQCQESSNMTTPVTRPSFEYVPQQLLKKRKKKRRRINI